MSKTPILEKIQDSQDQNEQPPKNYGKKMKDFDPTQIAQIILADMHCEAMRVKKLIIDDQTLKDDSNYCPCCGLPIRGEQFKLFCSILDFNELGYGVIFYFRHLQFLFTMLGLAFLIYGLPCLIDIAIRSYDAPWDDETSLAVKLSIGVFMIDNNEEDIPIWYGFLQVICTIVLIIGLFIFRSKNTYIQLQIDQFTISPADYTVLFKNVPKNTSDEDFVQYLQSQSFRIGPDTYFPQVIKKINWIYNLGEWSKQVQRYIQLKKDYNYVKFCAQNYNAHPNSCLRTYMTEQELLDQMKEVSHKVEELEEKTEDQNPEMRTCGVLVTFSKQEAARAVTTFFKDSWKSRLFRYFTNKFCKMGECCYNYSAPPYKGVHLRAARAPEPSDIYWENLHVTKCYRFLAIMSTFSITIVLIVAAFLSLEKIKVLEDNTKEQQDYSKTTLFTYQIILAIVVYFINQFLHITLRIFAKIEKPKTQTTLLNSQAIKLGVAMTVTTVFVLFFVHLPIDNFYETFQFSSDDRYDNTQEWFERSSLVDSGFMILVTQNLVAVFAPIINPILIYKCIMRCFIRCKRNLDWSQEDVNSIWEPKQLDLAGQYASSFKNFVLGLIFAPLWPLALPITMVGLFLQYWVDKFLFIKFFGLPRMLNESLSVSQLQMIPWSIAIFSFFTYQIYSTIWQESYRVCLLSILIALIDCIYPFHDIVRCCQGGDNKEMFAYEESYEQVAWKFPTDYDRSNPVTSTDGWSYYLTLYAKKSTHKVHQYQFSQSLSESFNFNNQYQFALVNNPQQNVPNYINVQSNIYQANQILIANKRYQNSSFINRSLRRSQKINSYQEQAVKTLLEISNKNEQQIAEEEQKQQQQQQLTLERQIQQQQAINQYNQNNQSMQIEQPKKSKARKWFNLIFNPKKVVQQEVQNVRQCQQMPQTQYWTNPYIENYNQQIGQSNQLYSIPQPMVYPQNVQQQVSYPYYEQQQYPDQNYQYPQQAYQQKSMSANPGGSYQQ